MKKILTFTTTICIFLSFAFITLCDSLLFFKEGASTVMTSYNKDNKVTGSVKTTYKKVTKSSDGAIVSANQESFDKKGKAESNRDFTIKCSKGNLYFDSKTLLASDQTDAYKNMEMKMEGDDMEIPSKLAVGDLLKDVNIKFSFSSKDGSPMPPINLTLKITNRKVELKESVTTTAGTFDCYKITEDVEMKSIFTSNFKSINWFSFEAGNVKTESYKENGKFLSKSELTEIKK